MAKRFVVALCLFAALTLTACGGSSSATESPSPAARTAEVPTPAATATPLPPTPAPAATVKAPLQPDGGRILADITYLAETIGTRVSGSGQEKAAADFLADRLRSLGYEVSFQEFPAAQGLEASRASEVAVQSPSQKTVPSAPFENSAAGTVTGNLVAAGLGAASDFPAAARGAVVLIARGDLQFVDKVSNAEAAGARGVIIYNNEPGIFAGALSRASTIPAVSISQTEGQALASQLASGPITVEMGVSPLGNAVSRNVIARPPGRECDTVSGGHYDTVSTTRGANDNSSGTATVLEIAAVLASRGEMRNNCFVLFGSEEPGLLGSKAYVKSLDDAAKTRLKAMLNFDMTGYGDTTWSFIGSPELLQRGFGLAKTFGIDAKQLALSATLGSDHLSFVNAGIPIFWMYRLELKILHTPQDTVDRVQPELLQQAAQMGVAMLEQLSAGA